MEFRGQHPPASASDVREVEYFLEFPFPQSLRRYFLSQNGGVPVRRAFSRPDLGVRTVIGKALPLIAESGMSAKKSYLNIVLDMELAPDTFFPFAVDMAGDYSLVNCDDGSVFFLDSKDYPEMRLVDLGLDLDGFWEELEEWPPDAED